MHHIEKCIKQWKNSYVELRVWCSDGMQNYDLLSNFQFGRLLLVGCHKDQYGGLSCLQTTLMTSIKDLSKFADDTKLGSKNEKIKRREMFIDIN